MKSTVTVQLETGTLLKLINRLAELAGFGRDGLAHAEDLLGEVAGVDLEHDGARVGLL